LFALPAKKISANVCVYEKQIIKANQLRTIIAVADTGGLQWFQLKPPLKERAPIISDDWYCKEQKSP